MADYFVELSQLGRTGKVYYETNFGFAFSTELIEISKQQNLSISRARTRKRVITLHSPCHQAAYDMKLVPLKLIKGETLLQKRLRETESAGYFCHVCGAESVFPKELISREYPEFDIEAVRLLQNCTQLAGLDTLDSIFVVDRLVEIVEGVWADVASGARVSEVLPRYSGKLEV